MPEILTEDHSGGEGTVVVRRIFHDQGVMDFAIESAYIEADDTFPVVALLSLGEDGSPVTRLLFLLIPAGPGVPAVSHAESRLVIDPALTSDKLVVYRTPIEASELTGTNLAAVSHSVAAAKLPERRGAGPPLPHAKDIPTRRRYQWTLRPGMNHPMSDSSTESRFCWISSERIRAG
jgi:hypothetical protein